MERVQHKFQSKFQRYATTGGLYWWGLAGSLIIALGCLIAGLAYRSPSGGRYSLLNYFISELGYLRESALAPVFNVSLIVGGLLMVRFIAGLGYYFTSKVGKAATLVGVLSGFSGTLVGVLPMDILVPHALAAFGFFYGAMVTIILFTVAIYTERDAPFPRRLGIVGILVAACFAIFNFTPFAGGTYGDVFAADIDFAALSLHEFRPAFWAMALFEWLCLLGVLAWVGITAMVQRRIVAQTKKAPLI
jgi:hypothetical membrane protein